MMVRNDSGRGRWAMSGVALITILGMTACDPGEATSTTSAVLEPITIGGIFNTTGGLKGVDLPALRGFELAAAQIDAGGGVLGRPLGVTTADGTTSPDIAAGELEAMVDGGVVAVGGLNGWEFALSPRGALRRARGGFIAFTQAGMVPELAPITESAGVPLVVTGVTDLGPEAGESVFSVAAGDVSLYGGIAAYAAGELARQRVWMVTDVGFDFTRSAASAFEEAFTAAGGEVVLETGFASGNRDLEDEIARFTSLDPAADVVFMAVLPYDVGSLVDLVRTAGVDAPIVGGPLFDTPVLEMMAGDRADDIYYSTHVAVDDPEVSEFVTAYQDEYDEPPESDYAFLGHDTLGLIVDAIERAGTAEPAAITDALAATGDFPALTGLLSYPEGRRMPEKTVTIVTVTDGRATYLDEF